MTTNERMNAGRYSGLSFFGKAIFWQGYFLARVFFVKGICLGYFLARVFFGKGIFWQGYLSTFLLAGTGTSSPLLAGGTTSPPLIAA